MIVNSDDFETPTGEPFTSFCCICKKDLTDKWINHTATGDLCISCAHQTMRILLQDIIGYHNNTSVSLLNVMYHGADNKRDPEYNPGPYDGNKKKSEKNSLFDF